MTTSLSRLAIMFALLPVAVGCNGQAAVSTTPDATAPPDAIDAIKQQAGDVTAGASGAATPDATVSVATVDRAAYDKVIASHQGKIVLVDFWATWCVPCRKQFPHTVEISQKYAEQDLRVVSVSMDEVESKQDVEKFLQSSGGEFDHLLSSYGIGQEGFESFELGDGGVPHYKIYDRKGVVRHATNDPDEIEPKIKELLGGGE